MNAIQMNAIYTLEEKIQRDITLTPEEARELYDRAIAAEREIENLYAWVEDVYDQAHAMKNSWRNRHE
jgi:hypothetical protein